MTSESASHLSQMKQASMGVALWGAITLKASSPRSAEHAMTVFIRLFINDTFLLEVHRT